MQGRQPIITYSVIHYTDFFKETLSRDIRETVPSGRKELSR